jgi:hypothetical protein
MARSSNGSIRIVAGEESRTYNTYQSFVWGAGGEHFGYVGYGTMIKAGDVILAGRATKYPAPRNVAFNADGSRSAFVGGDPFFGSLCLDGVEQKDVAVIAPTSTQSNTRAALFTLSPDGQSVAHHGFAGDRDKQGLVANGRLLAQFAQLYTAPVFTPDSRHVFAIVDNPGEGKAFAVLLNGQRIITLDALPFSSAGGAEPVSPFAMGTDGVFTLIGASGGEFKRYRITPSADHTLARAIADAAGSKQK